jgi:hypothetical protein
MLAETWWLKTMLVKIISWKYKKYLKFQGFLQGSKGNLVVNQSTTSKEPQVGSVCMINYDLPGLEKDFQDLWDNEMLELAIHCKRLEVLILLTAPAMYLPSSKPANKSPCMLLVWFVIPITTQAHLYLLKRSCTCVSTLTDSCLPLVPLQCQMQPLHKWSHHEESMVLGISKWA